MAWLIAFTHIKLLEWLLNRPVVVPLKFYVTHLLFEVLERICSKKSIVMVNNVLTFMIFFIQLKPINFVK